MSWKSIDPCSLHVLFKLKETKILWRGVVQQINSKNSLQERYFIVATPGIFLIDKRTFPKSFSISKYFPFCDIHLLLIDSNSVIISDNISPKIDENTLTLITTDQIEFCSIIFSVIKVLYPCDLSNFRFECSTDIKYDFENSSYFYETECPIVDRFLNFLLKYPIPKNSHIEIIRETIKNLHNNAKSNNFCFTPELISNPFILQIAFSIAYDPLINSIEIDSLNFPSFFHNFFPILNISHSINFIHLKRVIFNGVMQFDQLYSNIDNISFEGCFVFNECNLCSLDFLHFLNLFASFKAGSVAKLKFTHCQITPKIFNNILEAIATFPSFSKLEVLIFSNISKGSLISMPIIRLFNSKWMKEGRSLARFDLINCELDISSFLLRILSVENSIDSINFSGNNCINDFVSNCNSNPINTSNSIPDLHQLQVESNECDDVEPVKRQKPAKKAIPFRKSVIPTSPPKIPIPKLPKKIQTEKIELKPIDLNNLYFPPHINLSHCSFTPNSFSQLFHLISDSGRVKSLQFDYLHLATDCQYTFYRLFTQSNALRSLESFSWCGNPMDSDCLRDLSDFLIRSGRNFVNLSLSNSIISGCVESSSNTENISKSNPTNHLNTLVKRLNIESISLQCLPQKIEKEKTVNQTNSLKTGYRSPSLPSLNHLDNNVDVFKPKLKGHQPKTSIFSFALNERLLDTLQILLNKEQIKILDVSGQIMNSSCLRLLFNLSVTTLEELYFDGCCDVSDIDSFIEFCTNIIHTELTKSTWPVRDEKTIISHTNFQERQEMKAKLDAIKERFVDKFENSLSKCLLFLSSNESYRYTRSKSSCENDSRNSSVSDFTEMLELSSIRKQNSENVIKLKDNPKNSLDSASLYEMTYVERDIAELIRECLGTDYDDPDDDVLMKKYRSINNV